MTSPGTLQGGSGGLTYNPPPWTCLVAETTTGRIVGDLPFIGTPAWGCAIKSAGTADITTMPDADGAPNIQDLRAWVAGGRFSLVLAYGDWIAQAGPIWSHQWDDKAGTLRIGASGLGGLFDKRLLLPFGFGYSTDDQGTHFSSNADTLFGTTSAIPAANRNLSLHTILKRLIEQSVSRPNGSLPIVFPADIEGTSERTYRGWEMATVWERVVQLANVESGPDFELRPRFASTPGQIEWVLRIGNPRLVQAGEPPAWDYGAGLISLDVDRDASRLVSTVYVKGSGTDLGTRVGVTSDSTLTAAGWPLLEQVVSEHTSVELQSTLDAYARSYSAVLSRPVEVWSATVRDDGGDSNGLDTSSPNLGEFSAGDMAIFGIDGHRWLPDGQYTRRILGMASGSTPHEVNLTIEAGQGAI